MLVVEHFVAPSSVHGLGVFTRQFIPQGALVWRVHPAVDIEIRRADMQDLPSHVVRNIMTHAEYLSKRDVFRLSADGGYFMNHSDQANLRDAGDEMYAARDILEGEELFCDYRIVNVMAFNPNETKNNELAASGDA